MISVIAGAGRHNAADAYGGARLRGPFALVKGLVKAGRLAAMPV